MMLQLVLCKEILDENITLKEMMISCVEVMYLVVKIEEVMLGFKP
jgi:hypothetical protein